MNKIDSLKEIDLKKACFNLKSKTTGKFSINDSYKENLESGFLKEINAPTDVNIALKDMYYATERGLIISYKDFNNKILDNRRILLAQNFTGKDIKDLTKEERIKLETDSAKKVLKDLFITETTKLFYSPEFTKAKEEYINDSNIKPKFDFKELKALFVDIQKEDKEKEKLVKAFLDFSDEIKPVIEKALNSHNLDDVELTIIYLDKEYSKLEDYAKENLDIVDLYNKNRDLLVSESNIIKNRQNELEETLNKLADHVIENKNFKNLKKIIEKIESKFFENDLIKFDTKSNSIKDTVIEKLKNVGKLIALTSLNDWNETNFKTYDYLSTQSFNLELETLLSNKYKEEVLKKEALEQKLTEIDAQNYKEVLEKFFSMEGNKDLISKFFEILTQNGFDNLKNIFNSIDSQNFEKLLLLLLNKVNLEKIKPFWNSLDSNILDRITKEKFPYEDITKNTARDLYFECLINNSEQEMIEYTFYNIKKHNFRNINIDLTEKILLKLRSFSFELEKLISFLYPEKLLELLKYPSLFEDKYIKNSILRTLGKWMPALKVESEEFKAMILNYPEYGIYNLRKKQAQEVSSEFILQVIDTIKNEEDLGQFLIRVGKEKVEEALKFKYEKMAKDDPSNFDNQYTLGLSYLNEKNYEEAVSQFKRAIGINSESAVAHFNLGFTYDMMGKYDLALASYKKANQLKYNYIDAMYNLGLLYSKMNDHFLAMQQFKKILKIDPNHYESCMALGLTYDDMGDIENAINEYDKAITIDPTKTEAYTNKAACYSLQGKNQEALYAYDQILELDPNNPRIHFNIAVLYQKMEEFAMANAHYKISARLDPSNGQPFNNIGLVYFAQKKIDKAIQMWEKSIGVDNNIDAYNNLGWGLLVKGEFDRAIDVYTRAKKLDPKHAVLSLNLGTVYYRIGDVNNAIKELEEYLALEPNSENSFEVIKIIQSLKALKQ